MHTYIFIPDTNQNSGLGHLFRCLKYSNFIKKKKNKVIFLIKKNFNKKFLVNYNYNKKKINFIFYESLKDSLIVLRNRYDNIITFLDSYNINNHKINFQNYSKKHICINDFYLQSNCNIILDHTFKRKLNYHKNKNCKIYLGSKYFPIYKKLNFQDRNIILIDFGSIKNKTLINKSLNFINSIGLNHKYRIIIVNKFLSKKNLIKIDHKVTIYNYCKNIENIYEKTFFSIGSCGISLYEKCFYEIPTIAVCAASNQLFNYRNFKSEKCILDFDTMFKLSINNKLSKFNFLRNLNYIEKNIKKNFNYKNNLMLLSKLFYNLDEI